MDAEALIGPLLHEWRIEIDFIEGRYNIRYLDTTTGERTSDDPRLDALPSDCERIQRGYTACDPHYVAWFRNRATGEVMNSDPRLLPEALERRGVKLETLRLV